MTTENTLTATQGSTESESFTPSITWLNMSGDVTIIWDDTTRAGIIELVKQKMAEGYHFFVVTPRFLPILGNKKELLTKASQLKDAVGVGMYDNQALAHFARLTGKLNDKDVEAALGNPGVKLANPPKATLNTVKRATSPEEVVRSQSLAVRAVVGG